MVCFVFILVSRAGCICRNTLILRSTKLKKSQVFSLLSPLERNVSWSLYPKVWNVGTLLLLVFKPENIFPRNQTSLSRQCIGKDAFSISLRAEISRS